MKVELVFRGKLPPDPGTKTVPQGSEEAILAVSSRSVTLLEKDQKTVRLTRKMAFLTRATHLTASLNGGFVAGVTDSGQLFRFRELQQAQWIESPGLEKAKVEQLCVDSKGNLLVSCGGLTVYKFSAQTLAWEAFACPFPVAGTAKVRVAGCGVSNDSDLHATFAWLLEDNRLIVCKIGYKFLDKNQWHLREASQSLFSCSSSLSPSPDLSCFLLTSPSTVHLVHNSPTLPHFRREFTEEAVVAAAWCRNSELILVLSPGGKLAILAKFMNSLFGFEQTGNEHGVPESWMHVVNVEVGEHLELRPMLSSSTDSVLVCSHEVLSISVETTGHTRYLGRLLTAQPLSISVLSELCLHIASVKLLQREHVALLAVVRKNLSRGLAVSKSDQLEEIGRVLCNLIEWAVQLQSVPVVKLMVFALRRFLKADKQKKYREQMLDRYRAALRTFQLDGGSLKTRLEPEKLPHKKRSSRRRASSITECYYNGDHSGAMNCLVQNPEISSQSKEYLRRLLETKQESQAFEALTIMLGAQGDQLVEIVTKNPNVRSLLRMFASKMKHPSIALELLFIPGFWRDALKLSEHLGQHLLEAIVALCLNESRRAAEGLRDFILSRLDATDGEINDSVTEPVAGVLRLHPMACDDLFVDCLDLLLSELLEETSKISFDSPLAMTLTIEVGGDIPNQLPRLQLLCRSIQLLLLCSESCSHLLDALALTLCVPEDTSSRAIALLRCFVNMLFCFHLRGRLFQAASDPDSIPLAQQLYLNSFAPPHWLPSLAQIFYSPSISDEQTQRQAFSEFYDDFCQDVCSSRTKLRKVSSDTPTVRVSPESCFEKVCASVRKASKASTPQRPSGLVLIGDEELDTRLGALNVHQVRLRSGAKLDLRVLSGLLADVRAMSSRAFFCGILLQLDEAQVKRVRFNPIVNVAVDDSDEGDDDVEGRPQPAPRTKLLKSFSTSDASVQAGEAGQEKILGRKLDKALRSLERLSKLQKQLSTSTDRRGSFDNVKELPGCEDDLFDLGAHVESIELKDIPVTPRMARKFSRSQLVPGEGRFEESLRRIRDLTSRSIQRYQMSTKNFRSSLRGRKILRTNSSLSSLRVKVRPTESGVHTTMVIDRRTK